MSVRALSNAGQSTTAPDKPATDKPMGEGYQLEYLASGETCNAKTSTDNTVLCVVASQQPLP